MSTLYNSNLSNLNLSNYDLGSNDIKNFVRLYKEMESIGYPVEPFYNYLGNCSREQLDLLEELTLKLGYPVYAHRVDWDYEPKSIHYAILNYDIRSFTEFEYTLILNTLSDKIVDAYKKHYTQELESIITNALTNKQFNLTTFFNALNCHIPLDIAVLYANELGLHDSYYMYIFKEFSETFGHYPTPTDIKLVASELNTLTWFGNCDASSVRLVLFLTLIPDYAHLYCKINNPSIVSNSIALMVGALIESAYRTNTLSLLERSIDNLYTYLQGTVNEIYFMRLLVTANENGEAISYLNVLLEQEVVETILCTMSENTEPVETKLFTLKI